MLPNGPGAQLPAAVSECTKVAQPAAAEFSRVRDPAPPAAGSWAPPASPAAAAGQLQRLVRRRVACTGLRSAGQQDDGEKPKAEKPGGKAECNDRCPATGTMKRPMHRGTCGQKGHDGCEELHNALDRFLLPIWIEGRPGEAKAHQQK